MPGQRHCHSDGQHNAFPHRGWHTADGTLPQPPTPANQRAGAARGWQSRSRRKPGNPVTVTSKLCKDLFLLLQDLVQSCCLKRHMWHLLWHLLCLRWCLQLRCRLKNPWKVSHWTWPIHWPSCLFHNNSWPRSRRCSIESRWHRSSGVYFKTWQSIPQTILLIWCVDRKFCWPNISHSWWTLWYSSTSRKGSACKVATCCLCPNGSSQPTWRRCRVERSIPVGINPHPGHRVKQMICQSARIHWWCQERNCWPILSAAPLPCENTVSLFRVGLGQTIKVCKVLKWNPSTKSTQETLLKQVLSSHTLQNYSKRRKTSQLFKNSSPSKQRKRLPKHPFQPLLQVSNRSTIQVSSTKHLKPRIT